MNTVLLQNVIEMPNAALFVEQIKKYLDDEQKKRRHFYEIVEENKKMEFINGEIVVHSPSPFCEAKTFGELLHLISTFVSKNKLGVVTFGKAMISLTRNDYEPDICFFGNDKAKSFKKRQMQFPAPDFVVEVLSDSTAKHDRETKFQDYAAHGVQEYWIIDAEIETIEQYVLRDENYELLLKARDGSIQSFVLNEFVIPIRAVFDEQQNLETLAKIISSN